MTTGHVNFSYVDNPIGLPVPALVSISEALSGIEALLFLVGASSVFVRLRNARGGERQQVKWFAYATLLIALGIVLVIAGPELLGLDASQAPAWVSAALNGLWSIAILALPVSIGIAILRYGLYDIDLLINRTLVYGALVAAIVGIYVLVVGYIGLLFQTRGDVVSLVAAGIAAVLFQPLRQRLQVAVNRLLYGRRDEPYTVLSQLGRRLETVIESDALMPAIVETVRNALRVPYVALEVRSSEGEQIAAESGKASPIALRVAVPYQSERIGSLLVAARSPSEGLTAADQQLLEDVARQAGAALHAIGVTAEVRIARERLAEVLDDGRGLDPAVHTGTGFVSMRERAEELGGTCQIESAPAGGTRVLARLPIATQRK